MLTAISSFSVRASSLKRFGAGRSAFFSTQMRLNSMIDCSLIPTSFSIVKPLNSMIFVLM